MGILRRHREKALWIGALLVALLVIAGCAGIEPYEPRNNREEGPEKGLFTKSEGEFVIFRKADEPETGSEASKISDETADGEQQNTGSEEKEKKDEPKSADP
jgi:hypothetical protein